MEKYYPISSYMACIKKLGIPYPVSGLKAFLSSYTSKFTRQTNYDNILFDGIGDVIIKKVVNANMSSENIDKMLMAMVLHHGKKTDIVSRYKFASIELSKRGDPIIITIPSKTPKQTPIKKSLSTPSIYLKSFVDKINDSIALLKNKGSIKSITNDDILDILTAASLPVEVLKEKDFFEFLLDVWLEHNKIAIFLDRTTWPSLFPEIGTTDDSITSSMAPSQILEEISSRLYKIQKSRTLPPIKADSATKAELLNPKVTKAIVSAKKEAIQATPENPAIKNNVKCMFKNLLATHNTSLDTALNMFMGKYTFIKGVEKTGDHVYPSGRGAQFRWGIDSQYGDVIFIMKPEFWKRYSKGVYEAGGGPMIKNGVVFNDFWREKQMDELDAYEEMMKEAKEFGFREPRAGNSSMCSTMKERNNLTWCNIQIHIGENVSFDDIDTVLLPRYLTSPLYKNLKFEDSLVSDIIFKARFDEKIDGKNIPNPFYQKIVFYGPLMDDVKGPHPHYSIAIKNLRKNRDPIYDQIFKGYQVAEIVGDKLEKEAFRNSLHRDRMVGHSSMMGLSKVAFADAQEEYMYKLVEHRMTV